ncbi:anhydro-N-acetylmuramic acid kinase [Pseudonocardia eucalypti]|uniref:Anhydro-N-acetylmuramic acid kinase n=1 Tax=Pseudonocardia eucalypti TaxID=648755 RepID=A0ABP9Q2L7_9PSEU|nr:anhydro-N-acetylmuramic acid kinase [Pseudonocardia eucalypti]
MIVLGLSSGTSVDGIDVAAADLELDGKQVWLRPLGHREVAYSAGLRGEILAALPPAATTVEAITRIDTGIGREFASAAARANSELAGGAAELVVSHGQTVFHWVSDGRALGGLQLGQPAWIAEATGLPVVSDVRSNDIAAGGQGAPLASVLDVLLLGGRPGVSAALNIGGIANVTVVRPGEPPVAFDTGPGNALIDAAVRRATGGAESYDAGGQRALRGTVAPALLTELLAEPYYSAAPPKSTGKELFHPGYLPPADRLGPDDLVATLTELTARTVADACAAYRVTEVIASGGGVRNPALLAALRRHLAPAVLTTSDALGVPAEAKEAYLFALLGFLSWHGVAATAWAATGARHPTVAGRITPGARPLRLPPPASAPPARLLLRPAAAGARTAAGS